MKKRILAAILAVLMIFPLAIVAFANTARKINYVATDWGTKEDRVNAMGDPVATSPDGNMLMYVDRDSGEMAIKNAKTGDIVLSNPQNINSSDLLKREKPYALSQLDLNYTINSTGEGKTLHSYSDAFAVNQATITVVENGIQVYYMLGEQEKRLLIPNKISVDDMMALLDECLADRTETAKENIKTTILGAYNLYCSEAGAGEILTKYPKLGDSYIWLESPTAERISTNVREYPICATIPVFVIKTAGSGNKAIENYFISKDANDEQRAEFEKKLDETYKKVEEKGIDDFSTSLRPKFEITATYKVTNSGLEASVDASTLAYDTTLYTVNTVSILPYFNAASASNIGVDENGDSIKYCDKGYTFIPDGSGAIVRFEDLFEDNNKQVKFENDMYGNDYTYYQVKIKNAENMTMPVFGLSNETEKAGFVAVIEDCDALSTIISNHSTAYHSIYTSFKLTPSDVYDLADSFSGGSSSSKKIGITSSNTYKGMCKVSYTLLTDDEVAQEAGISSYYENSYVGMAKFYKEYLEKKGAISKIPDSEINTEFVKLFIETFGSIKVEEKIATFPVTVNKELTTFEDIKTIYKELKEAGVGNTSYILKGFANGGLLSTYPTKIKWQKVLGGKKGFNDLMSYAKENDFDVIPDVEFSYSYGSKAFSGYSNKKHGARTLDNRYTTKRVYYAATQTFERTGGVAVSSAAFDYLYEKFYKSISVYDIEYLSVRTLGSDLNSDFDKEEYYDREAVKDQVIEMLGLLKGSSGNKDYKLVLDGGNSYAMPYASAVLSASLDSSRRSEMSESVPFYGMVYHGSVEFTGSAYNMEGDTEYAFLKAIENGATLYFTVAMQNVELLKFNPEYNKYYSVSYANLKDTIVSTYKEFNGLMKDLQNKYIVDHDFLDATRTKDGGKVDSSLVVMVEYEGGIGFVLNYSSYEIDVELPNGESATIAPFGYNRYTK
ncbi:MAG: hypothetical protein J6D23_07595 [Clostridia bacterium]|nr:hypothetical protein [Clostridia bacterium]